MIEMLKAIEASDVTYRLGWTLIHSLWLGAGIAAALALVLAALRRGGALVRYGTACGALVLLVVGMGWTYWVLPARTPRAQVAVRAVKEVPAVVLPSVPLVREHRVKKDTLVEPAVAESRATVAIAEVKEPLGIRAEKM